MVLGSMAVWCNLLADKMWVLVGLVLKDSNPANSFTSLRLCWLAS
jgi:hypothetical protein